MKIEVAGEVFEWDGRLRLKEALQIKASSSDAWTPVEWGQALANNDPEALALLVLLAQKRAGRDVRLGDLDFSLDEVQVIDDEAPAEPDPTEPVSDAVDGSTSPTPTLT